MLPFELTKDTPYLALSGELWSVFYEYFNRNWPCYKGFLLYCVPFVNVWNHSWWGMASHKCDVCETKNLTMAVIDLLRENYHVLKRLYQMDGLTQKRHNSSAPSEWSFVCRHFVWILMKFHICTMQTKAWIQCSEMSIIIHWCVCWILINLYKFMYWFLSRSAWFSVCFQENRKSLQLSDLFQELQSCQQAVQNLESKVTYSMYKRQYRYLNLNLMSQASIGHKSYEPLNLPCVQLV